MLPSGRDLRSRDGNGIAGGRQIVPLYRCLPRGPHGIAPERVVHNQRVRMYGAMIEAVALHGYEGTSVRHVVGLAGVSRRAFYEQFSNKRGCFIATFDVIVSRIMDRIESACRAGGGSPEQRLQAGLQALVGELRTNPKALHLVLIDVLAAGPEARRGLYRALAASERLLAGALSCCSAVERPLPDPLVGAVTGGIRRVIFTGPRGRLQNSSLLSRELLRLTLLFAAPAAARLRLRPSAGPSPSRGVLQLPRSEAGESGERTRLLEGAINVVLRESYDELSAPGIAEEAGLSIDPFLEHFGSPRECLMEALKMLGEDLLEVAADPALVSARWPTAVCQAIDRLTIDLVANPASTVMLAIKTLDTGMGVIEEMVTLANTVNALLIEGAPRRPYARLTQQWIAGALAHMLHNEIVAGRWHRLDSLAEYMSYIVLAPYLGPEQATHTIIEARRGADRL
jgi:AcrR family transcriptional regulator